MVIKVNRIVMVCFIRQKIHWMKPMTFGSTSTHSGKLYYRTVKHKSQPKCHVCTKATIRRTKWILPYPQNSQGHTSCYLTLVLKGWLHFHSMFHLMWHKAETDSWSIFPYWEKKCDIFRNTLWLMKSMFCLKEKNFLKFQFYLTAH